MIAKLRLVFSISIFFMGFYGLSQLNYWEIARRPVATDMKSLPNVDMGKSLFFSLNKRALVRALSGLDLQGNNTAEIYFPDNKGNLKVYEVHSVTTMAPELAARYPNIRSYAGYAKASSKERIRFSVSPQGVQSMMVHKGGANSTFLQQISKEKETYVLYDKAFRSGANFECHTESIIIDHDEISNGTSLVGDGLLRKYRLAVSATGEYTRFHGGTVADALAAITATVNRINEVFEADLGIHLELVANNDAVIFTDPLTDPYSTNLNAQAQRTLSATIGEENYDVGHVFNQDQDNGNAGFIGSVCIDNRKGSAFSSGLVPEGDQFDLDFVAHELGHQFGANHTWSFDAEGTSVQAEPGSGTTIMGYAGIAGADNVALQGDDYFHYNSIVQITTYLETTSCAEEMSLVNNPPQVMATGNFMIPKATAFVLEADASDIDTGDVLTYAWEQIDNGVINAANFGPENVAGANFRSQMPSTNPERFFPKLSRILDGNLTQSNPTVNSAWETVSNIARDMNFALTVRDNAVGGGQVTSDIVNVKVVGNAGPFTVSSQASGEAYEAGTRQTITWEVANTNRSPINAEEVTILLSVDGGLTYPIVLAENVLNDGIQEVLIPNVPTAAARIMIKPKGHIFLAVNADNFSITPSTIVLNFDELNPEICIPNTLVLPFTYEAESGFNEEVRFSVENLPPGVNADFSPAFTNESDIPVTLTLSNVEAAAIGEHPITISAIGTTAIKDIVLNLTILDNSFSEVVKNAPIDGIMNARIAPLLEWETNPAYTAYDVEIATDITFATLVETVTTPFTSYNATTLAEQTTYYWRVKPKNSCGEGVFGSAFSFTTVGVDCTSEAAKDVPLSINAVGTPTVVSRISFGDDLPIADLNVNLAISHSFVSDLTVRLISPMGTSVVLFSNSCGGSDNISATFDDDATDVLGCGSNPAISGTIQPLGSLAAFNGESLFGEWILEVNDSVSADGGSINAFSIDVCVEGALRPDADNDGVFDDGDDLCPNTSEGAEVDSNGCEIFRFPQDNFSISVNPESCIDLQDATIRITAENTLDYTITVVGEDITVNAQFNEQIEINDLTQGNYEICITASAGDMIFEPFCNMVVVPAAESFTVVTAVSQTNRETSLSLSGGALYTIVLNGETQTTEASEITLDLLPGSNRLQVRTDLECQGVFEENLFITSEPLIFPNPFVATTTIFLGVDVLIVDVGIYDSSGRFMNNQMYTVVNNRITMDFSAFPSGVYYIRLMAEGLRKSYAISKR